MSYFAKDFMLGAATAAHQVEGNNTTSDFWAIEQMENSLFKEPSLDSVDHYNRYKEDIDLLARVGLDAYRFSIEWARVEPVRGEYDDAAIAHYREKLAYCRQRGVKPIVTMHHFSSPKWLIKAGGWESETTIDYFAEYCAYVANELGDQMEYVCTINEANMGLQITKIISEKMKQMKGDVQVGINEDVKDAMAGRMASLSQVFGGIDPREISIFLAPKSAAGDAIIMRAHEKARDAMKAAQSHLKIGVTLSLHYFQALPGGEKLAEQEYDDEFLHYLPYLQKDDFIGVQNYSRKLVGPEGVQPPPEGAELTQMGYEYYPRALEAVVRYVAGHLDKPIIVTENGIATKDDSRRVAFINEALQGIKDCLQDDIPVKGYMHWTLLDNFEWMLGYEPQFGLIAVDRKTQRRIPKPSLRHLGSFK